MRPHVTLLNVAVWVGAVFLSILVHELGHAIAFRYFGCRPRITLYGFGGLASADREPAGRARARIIIAAAGPLAGFVLAALTIALVANVGYRVPVLRWTVGGGAPIESTALYLLVVDLVYVNVVWGLVNLLPVQPLDGGQIALELSRAHNPVRGVERSIWISFVTAIAAAIVGIVVFESLYTCLLFGYLAYSSAQVLRRQYLVSFDVQRAARRARDRWRAWGRARRRSAIGLSVVRELRDLERIDDTASSAESDRLVNDVLRSAAERAKRAGVGRVGERSRD
jgi:Zn-dependent protease